MRIKSDLERDRKVGDMLVIPMYEYYRHEGKTDTAAIAHPFVYQQGTDIEKKLASFGQRDRLVRLIFWVPGYFPDGMGRMFSWVPKINDKRMVVKELLECIGKEEGEINSAMKDLLLGGDFTVGEAVGPEPPPPPYYDGKMSTDPYNPDKLVRCSGYCGRYFDYQAVLHAHLLWGLNTGDKIANRLSEEDKKTVTAFAAAAEKRMKEKQASKEKETAKAKQSPDEAAQKVSPQENENEDDSQPSHEPSANNGK
jgi:hypothetical protein